MIIDAHAHLSPSEFGGVDIYLNQLRQAGIGQAVVVPGGMVDVRKMTDYVTGRSKPDSLIPNNDYVREAAGAHPDTLYGFFCVNPHDSDAPDQLENAARDGFRGLKLSPITHQFSFASKSIATLAALCGELGFPVYTHVVFSPGASTSRLVALARQFPQTNFILGHMGFGPADREAMEAAAELDNLYLETSVGNYLGIREAIAKAGAGKIIFGSEFPLSHPVVELQKVMLIDVSDYARERILGGNIRELLNLPATPDP